MHRIMKIHKLFIECLAIDYSHSGEGVDFALKIDRDSLYIYFQDSEGLEDWRVNINFPAKAYKREGRGEFYAHRGFLNSWESVKEKSALPVKSTPAHGWSPAPCPTPTSRAGTILLSMSRS